MKKSELKIIIKEITGEIMNAYDVGERKKQIEKLKFDKKFAEAFMIIRKWYQNGIIKASEYSQLIGLL